MNQLVETSNWGSDNWMPCLKDVLKCYCRSTGVSTERIRYNNVKFKFLDCGGVRSERKKLYNLLWQFHRQPVHVMFFVSLSEYNENLFEACLNNRLSESLKYFEEFTRFVSKNLRNCDMTLVFTKIDIFEEKLCNLKIPLNISGLFPEAPVTHSLEEGFNWVRDEFLSKSHLENVDVQVCNTLNRDDVKQVLKTCLDKRIVKEAHLLHDKNPICKNQKRDTNNIRKNRSRSPKFTWSRSFKNKTVGRSAEDYDERRSDAASENGSFDVKGQIFYG